MSEYVNPETGEVEEIPEGEDRLFWVARRLREAQDQEKEWGKSAAGFKRTLLEEQTEKRAVYGDVAISVRQRPMTTFQGPAFREYVADAQLDGGALLAMVLAAKDFDIDAIADEAIADLLRPFVIEGLTRPFVIAERVKKLHPSTARQEVA